MSHDAESSSSRLEAQRWISNSPTLEYYRTRSRGDCVFTS
jgi:hypothetical protein